MSIISALKLGNVETLESHYVVAVWLRECAYAQWVPKGKVSSESQGSITSILREAALHCDLCLTVWMATVIWMLITVVKGWKALPILIREHPKTLIFQFHISLRWWGPGKYPLLLCATISFRQISFCPVWVGYRICTISGDLCRDN